MRCAGDFYAWILRWREGLEVCDGLQTCWRDGEGVSFALRDCGEVGEVAAY